MPAIPAPSAAAPFADYKSAWPPRLPLGEKKSNTIALSQPNVVWEFSHARLGQLLPRPEDESAAAAVLTAAGLPFEPGQASSAIRLEGQGAFLARFPSGPRRTIARRTPGLEHFLIASATPAAAPDQLPSLERTWFAFYEPLTPKNADPLPPRGVALLMPGIFGTPEGSVEATISSLRARNWHVLRLLAQPSRFTQTVTFTIDPAAHDADIDALGANIAAVLTGRAAECAYAVQGAFEHVLEQHPELKDLPRIAVGFSGGAITLPIVVAREPERYHAAVLVGGACHYWLINAHSTYADMISAIKIIWTTPPTLDDRRRVADAYLRHAPLDSFHTAAALHGVPTLMIQANADSAVPAVLGDVLWERLGKPERWIKLGEHLPLFITLSKDLPAINDWLDAKVAAPKPAAPADPKVLQSPSRDPLSAPKGPK
jgi:hypothetical protein